VLRDRRPHLDLRERLPDRDLLRRVLGLGVRLDCTVRDRAVVGAADPQGSWVDGNPTLELDVAAGRLRLADELPEPFAVDFALERATDGN